jgi:hypothetical protein
MGLISIDPINGTYSKLAWGSVPLPEWQRVAR